MRRDNASTMNTHTGTSSRMLGSTLKAERSSDTVTSIPWNSTHSTSITPKEATGACHDWSQPAFAGSYWLRKASRITRYSSTSTNSTSRTHHTHAYERIPENAEFFLMRLAKLRLMVELLLDELAISTPPKVSIESSAITAVPNPTEQTLARRY